MARMAGNNKARSPKIIKMGKSNRKPAMGVRKTQMWIS